MNDKQIQFEMLFTPGDSPKPSFMANKHLYSPGRKYKHIMPKIEIEIKVYGTSLKDEEYMQELFEYIYQKIERDTFKRITENGCLKEFNEKIFCPDCPNYIKCAYEGGITNDKMEGDNRGRINDTEGNRKD